MSTATTKVISPIAILSYPHLAAPQPSTDGKPPKYSATLIFTPETLADPKEKAFFEGMQKAALAAIETKWPGKAQQMLQSETFKKGFRRDAEAKNYPPGSIFVNVRSSQQPGIVYAHAGPDGKPERMPLEKIKDEMYPGVIVRASLAAFAYDNNGNKGVSFGLNNLQKLRNGERMDGRVAAENEFTADLSAEPADIASLI
jgi:Protein of unknown function (DUF2815).